MEFHPHVVCQGLIWETGSSCPSSLRQHEEHIVLLQRKTGKQFEAAQKGTCAKEKEFTALVAGNHYKTYFKVAAAQCPTEFKLCKLVGHLQRLLHALCVLARGLSGHVLAASFAVQQGAQLLNPLAGL
ncbi:hypothetical protein F7725_022513 [Dissostichus mawsoni]|uniref:Uncharacterized protein n=1 Tax=Dissostichus mawsoni TaxID=36200 RepID=A0A7J5Z2C6_DISMA|nr:hypothetical protein F7725_022513 [Dissostichus mawsoni]